MSRKLALIIGLIAACGVVAHADLEWLNYATNYIAYADASTPLAGHISDSSIGCFVQLIWTGEDGEIDAAINSGDGTTDDDEVHQTSWFSRGAFGADGIMDAAPNFTDDSNGYYYVRAWTAPSPDYDNGLVPTSLTNYYGNSLTWDNPQSELPTIDQFNFGGELAAGNVGWSTTLQVIPEPSIFALLALGLFGIRVYRRKHQKT